MEIVVAWFNISLNPFNFSNRVAVVSSGNGRMCCDEGGNVLWCEVTGGKGDDVTEMSSTPNSELELHPPILVFPRNFTSA